MIDLVQLGAVALPTPPAELSHVRNLLEYDGVLLAEFRNGKNEPYLYHWCDSDTDLNRWLLFRTSHTAIAKLLVQRVTLRSLLQEAPDGHVFAIDVDANITARHHWLLPVALIPQEYLPSETPFFANTTSDAKYQDVYISDQWDFDELREYPRRYRNAYSFAALFGKGRDRRGTRVDYRLTSGWVFQTMFAKLERDLGQEERAKIAEFSIASPGYLRMKVIPGIAERIRTDLRQYTRFGTAIRSATQVIRQWANEKPGVSSAECARKMSFVCNILRLDEASIRDSADNPKTAAKMLVAYVHRIDYLAVCELDEAAFLVGIEPLAAPHGPSRGATDESILNCVRTYPGQTLQEIVAVLEAEASTVRASLRRLVATGVLRKSGKRQGATYTIGE